ncbi:hypothetical protein ATANTOWER_029102 [Ataeniobius toweri]|uniref:Uncharacterized protein n=1 Tax=Ataeniobius toweri TaxID=208326 RepID=A0ABU7A8G0_9TELE|nr:hypothetical protein [Ataeniobius toweri]
MAVCLSSCRKETCMCCPFQVMYTRAVWKEGEQEEEAVVPDNWIDRNKRSVRWPHSMSITKTERALKEKINPEDDWMTFPLIKIKITSGKFCFKNLIDIQLKTLLKCCFQN